MFLDAGRNSCIFFMMKIALITIFLFTSCQAFQFGKEKRHISLNKYTEYTKLDYIEHLKSFEKVYLDENRLKIKPVDKASEKYLKGIVENIISNNELFFNQIEESTFYIIKSETPFHFSLPGRKFFFSDSLLSKYIKNESILYCLIVYELIKSEKNMYNKNIIIPTGVMSTARILSLLKIETSDKVEIHKWAFYILKRTGIDTDNYLSWLQIKNRNSLDFAIQVGDVQSISREESLFKTFLIQEIKTLKRSPRQREASRAFYKFISKLRT